MLRLGPRGDERQEDPLACHDLIDEIECQVLEALHVHLVIHYDPVVEDDAEWNAMRQAVEGWWPPSAPAVGPRLPPGPGAKQTKMVFDLAVPMT